MTAYSVGIETEGPVLTDEQLVALADKLEAAEEASAAAVSQGGRVARGVGAQIGLRASDPAEAAEKAMEVFAEYVASVGARGRVKFARIDVMTEAYEERWLNEPPESYVGVAEVAELFSVSRARVSELRRQRGFPAPIAELAAGPVWHLSSLQRFLSEWPRKPGRPRAKGR